MYRFGLVIALFCLTSTAQEGPASAEADSGGVADSVAAAGTGPSDTTATAKAEVSAAADMAVENDAATQSREAADDQAATETKAVAQPDTSAETDEAVILEEEDIFTEISKQGIRLDAQEESLIDEPDVSEAAATQAGEHDSAVVDSSATVVSGEEDDDMVGPGGATVPRPRGSRPGTQTVTSLPTDTGRPIEARIEDARSVNFARNLEEYRSPKLAMFLSLLVPGLGQAYAKSNWKTALFGVLELGIIGVSVGYNVAGRNATEDAYDFADQHYDPGDTLFANYYNELYQFFEERIQATDDTVTAQQLIDEIYYPMNERESFMETYEQHRYSKSDRYYDWIDEKSYVQGWDDCVPAFDTIRNANPSDRIDDGGKTFFVHDHSDSAYLVYIEGEDPNVLYYGYSENRNTYSDMLSTANGYFRTSTNVLFLLIVNHIASAIDAGITAKRYNDKLLGRESFWEHIGVEQRFVNTGSDVVPGYSLCIRF
ncbi:MAG: hypothetical protein GF331_22125 [Chitinivibrionales bacterium]|nr:hypothetical protein [Chitinivibrionales bacterium]